MTQSNQSDPAWLSPELAARLNALSERYLSPEVEALAAKLGALTETKLPPRLEEFAAAMEANAEQLVASFNRVPPSYFGDSAPLIIGKPKGRGRAGVRTVVPMVSASAKRCEDAAKLQALLATCGPPEGFRRGERGCWTPEVYSHLLRQYNDLVALIGHADAALRELHKCWRYGFNPAGKGGSLNSKLTKARKLAGSSGMSVKRVARASSK